MNKINNDAVRSGQDVLITEGREQTTLSEALGACKGKLIYVDFWASWCAPCRALMSRAHELNEKYKEDVSFLYISIDGNPEAWLTASKAEKLDKSSSYWMSHQSNFVVQRKIKTIPRFMIFDRSGKLIDDDAFRPDDKDFETKINRLILL